MGNSYKGQDRKDEHAFYKQNKTINVKEWNKLFKIKQNVGVRRYTYKLPPNENKPSKWLAWQSIGLSDQWESLQS